MSSNYTEIVTLPSRGILNPEIPNGEVTLRCITVADQKFISGNNLSGDRLLNELLKRCVEEPKNFDPNKLTSIDTFFLVTKLRILSYGGNYRFTTKCPECGAKLTVDIDLANLRVEFLEEDYQDTMSVKLPRSGDIVYTRLLTNEDEADIDRESKRFAKKFNINNNNFILKLVKSIVRIELSKANKNGEKVLENPIHIQEYLEGLTDLDATAISSTASNVNYGIQPVMDYTCPKCKEDVEIGLRFNSQFFRPRYEALN